MSMRTRSCSDDRDHLARCRPPPGGACRLDDQRRVWVEPRGVVTPALRTAFPGLKTEIVAELVGGGGAVDAQARTSRARAAGGRCR